ncbi:hypothetical protein BDY19DRAFT_908799 [Irpex rosettiformis]|uniref:Uncharacterized protein n=1 Tax=Irpex rosettiformis TaxID=378272 RepID=A0ACB8TVC2_9APHY|nr:hypothetical protein BDY19DRAFT_908799 [Irpex rosettiformis]
MTLLCGWVNAFDPLNFQSYSFIMVHTLMSIATDSEDVTNLLTSPPRYQHTKNPTVDPYTTRPILGTQHSCPITRIRTHTHTLENKSYNPKPANPIQSNSSYAAYPGYVHTDPDPLCQLESKYMVQSLNPNSLFSRGQADDSVLSTRIHTTTRLSCRIPITILPTTTQKLYFRRLYQVKLQPQCIHTYANTNSKVPTPLYYSPNTRYSTLISKYTHAYVYTHTGKQIHQSKPANQRYAYPGYVHTCRSRSPCKSKSEY